MQLPQWILRFLEKRRWIRRSRQVVEDPRERFRISLDVTRLEERRVLNAAPVDVTPDDAPALEVVTINAGNEADDGSADTFRISRDGLNVNVTVNDQIAYSGDWRHNRNAAHRRFRRRRCSHSRSR